MFSKGYYHFELDQITISKRFLGDSFTPAIIRYKITAFIIGIMMKILMFTPKDKNNSFRHLNKNFTFSSSPQKTGHSIKKAPHKNHPQSSDINTFDKKISHFRLFNKTRRSVIFLLQFFGWGVIKKYHTSAKLFLILYIGLQTQKKCDK